MTSLIMGNSYKEIAHKLKLSEGTIKMYISNIRKKNKCRTTAQAAAQYALDTFFKYGH